MGHRSKCPDCGTEQSATKFQEHGCWFCNQDDENRATESEFADFMALDEDDRWRALWEASRR